MEGPRTSTAHLRFGGVALLVGVLATVVTAYTIYSRSRRESVNTGIVSEDGWYDEVGF